jgi:hypothetical protein
MDSDRLLGLPFNPWLKLQERLVMGGPRSRSTAGSCSGAVQRSCVLWMARFVRAPCAIHLAPSRRCPRLLPVPPKERSPLRLQTPVPQRCVPRAPTRSQLTGVDSGPAAPDDAATQEAVANGQHDLQQRLINELPDTLCTL